jgi:hypothetical protein
VIPWYFLVIAIGLCMVAWRSPGNGVLIATLLAGGSLLALMFTTLLRERWTDAYTTYLAICGLAYAALTATASALGSRVRDKRHLEACDRDRLPPARVVTSQRPDFGRAKPAR